MAGCLVSSILLYMAYSIRTAFKRVKTARTNLFSPVSFDSEVRDSVDKSYDEPATELNYWSLKETLGEIDGSATANATAKAAGRLSVRFRMLPVRPRFMLIVERVSGNDLLVSYIKMVARRLSEREVHAEVYEVAASGPRNLIRQDVQARRASVAWVADLGAKALVWSGPDLFTDPLTESLPAEIGDFLEESEAIVTTPYISQMTAFQKLTDRGVRVSTSATALAVLHQASGRSGVSAITQKPFPSELKNKYLDWQAGVPRHAFAVRRLMLQLHKYLGEEGMRILGACAAYPELRFDFMEELVFYFCTSPANYDNVLGSLVQLPWFRYGYMPDWIRVSILLALSDAERTSLRKLINEVFRKKLRLTRGTSRGIEKRSWSAALFDEGLKKLFGNQYVRQVGEDRVLVAFVLGEDLRSLVDVPATLLSGARQGAWIVNVMVCLTATFALVPTVLATLIDPKALPEALLLLAGVGSFFVLDYLATASGTEHVLRTPSKTDG